jgi:hypothetical protein
MEEYKDPDRKDDAWKKIADNVSIGGKYIHIYFM